MHAYINGVSKDVFRDDSRQKSILANTIELIDVALDGARAPSFGQPSVDRVPIAAQIPAEAAEFLGSIGLYIGDPRLQVPTATFPAPCAGTAGPGGGCW